MDLLNIIDNSVHLVQTMSFDELDRCLDLITYNGAKTLNVEDKYGIEVGKLANFLVLASIRHGEYRFKRPAPCYDIALDLFRKNK